jgi:hypothetical protein
MTLSVNLSNINKKRIGLFVFLLKFERYYINLILKKP